MWIPSHNEADEIDQFLHDCASRTTCSGSAGTQHEAALTLLHNHQYNIRSAVSANISLFLGTRSAHRDPLVHLLSPDLYYKCQICPVHIYHGTGNSAEVQRRRRERADAAFARQLQQAETTASPISCSRKNGVKPKAQQRCNKKPTPDGRPASHTLHTKQLQLNRKKRGWALAGLPFKNHASAISMPIIM